MSQEQVTDATPEQILAAAAQTHEAPVDETAAEEVEAAPKEEPKPEPKVEDKFAPKFAALSRQEKALKAREKALAAREAALAERDKPAAAAPAAPQEPLELRLKKDTFGTLKELGLSPEVLVQMMLNDGKPTPELQMALMKEEITRAGGSKVEQLEAKLAAIEKKEQEREQKVQAEQDAKLVSGFKSQIADFIKADPDKYDLLATEDEYGIDLVYDVIAQDAQAKQEELGEEFTGDEIMSIEEAASKIEEQLLEAAKKRIERSKKVKGLFGTTSAPATQSSTPQKKASPTLSNVQSQVQSPGKAAQSDADRLAAAIALISSKAQ